MKARYADLSGALHPHRIGSRFILWAGAVSVRILPKKIDSRSQSVETR